MVDFTQLTPEQIVSYVAKHSHFFASTFDEGFPDNIARTVAGPLWATIRRREGFAIVFKGMNPLFGGDGKNADLMFLHVLPEYEKQGIGTEIVKEAKAAVPQGRTIDVTCEGAARMRLFARCGFIVNHHQADADIYQMRWSLTAPSTED